MSFENINQNYFDLIEDEVIDYVNIHGHLHSHQISNYQANFEFDLIDFCRWAYSKFPIHIRRYIASKSTLKHPSGAVLITRGNKKYVLKYMEMNNEEYISCFNWNTWCKFRKNIDSIYAVDDGLD